MKDDIIEITNLTLPYAFNDFDFKIPKDKIIFISGPNSCGKTTLIRTMAGQIKTKNMIFFGNVGLENYHLKDIEEKIKVIIPNEDFFYYDTVKSEIEHTINNLHSKDKEVTTAKIIKQYGLTKYIKSDPNKLDYFYRLKLQLTLALLFNPTLLLLDDIFNSLQEKEKVDIINLIKNHQENHKISIIMTTSKLEDSLYGDYLYIIKDSSIVLEGEPLEVLKKDNELNKIGLELPFSVDLSVKLHDYDLLNKIETDIDRMIDSLWK